MAAVNTTAKILLPLNLSDHLHQGQNGKSFRRAWKLNELAAGIHKNFESRDKVRVASLWNEKIRPALKIDKVWERLEERRVPVLNETYKRFVFFKREQLSNNFLDSYIVT